MLAVLLTNRSVSFAVFISFTSFAEFVLSYGACPFLPCLSFYRVCPLLPSLSSFTEFVLFYRVCSRLPSLSFFTEFVLFYRVCLLPPRIYSFMYILFHQAPRACCSMSRLTQASLLFEGKVSAAVVVLSKVPPLTYVLRASFSQIARPKSKFLIIDELLLVVVSMVVTHESRHNFGGSYLRRASRQKLAKKNTSLCSEN